MKTTAEIKAAIKTIRTLAAGKGLTVTVSRSRRGVEPSVYFNTDAKVFGLDAAIAFLTA
jgi:hypothetical protein